MYREILVSDKLYQVNILVSTEATGVPSKNGHHPDSKAQQSPGNNMEIKFLRFVRWEFIFPSRVTGKIERPYSRIMNGDMIRVSITSYWIKSNNYLGA